MPNSKSDSAIQPVLLELETVSPEDELWIENGKSAIRKMLKLRRELLPEEKIFIEHFDKAIKEMKFIATLTSDRREKLLMLCIEGTHAHTWAELEHDTHLSQKQVRETLDRLEAKDLIEYVPRYTVGGSVKQMLIFSKRRPCSCVY